MYALHLYSVQIWVLHRMWKAIQNGSQVRKRTCLRKNGPSCPSPETLPFLLTRQRTSWFAKTAQGINVTQCENFRICLPLIFCMKSILIILKPPKTAIWTILSALHFETLGFGDIFKSEKSPKIKIQSLQNCWNGSFWASQTSQNWFHVKSEWQKNPKISTLCFTYFSRWILWWVPT